MPKDDRLYGKFTLDFPDNYKILPLSDAAFRCLVEATLWSRKQMSDGLLARRYALAKWGADVLAELATNDPENPSLIEVEEGWMIRDFAEHQDTRAEIEARSARNKAAGQRGGLARAKRRAKQVASESLSESQAETETETETSTHVGKTTHVSNARKRESSSRFSDGTPIPEEPPAGPGENVVVGEIIPTEIGTAARPRAPRAEPAHKSTVRLVLGGADYPDATINQLAVQVAKLAGKHDAELIAEALREWDRRPPGTLPAYLPNVLGDVVKARRARPTTRKSTTDERMAAVQALKHQPAPEQRRLG